MQDCFVTFVACETINFKWILELSSHAHAVKVDIFAGGTMYNIHTLPMNRPSKINKVFFIQTFSKFGEGSVAKNSESQTAVNFIHGRGRQPISSPIFRQAKMRPNV